MARKKITPELESPNEELESGMASEQLNSEPAGAPEGGESCQPGESGLPLTQEEGTESFEPQPGLEPESAGMPEGFSLPTESETGMESGGLGGISQTDLEAAEASAFGAGESDPRGVRRGKGTMAYVCPGYPECDSYVLARPDTLKPMGALAWPELRRLRRAAHVSFNRLYESGLMTKREAYRWLAGIVQAPKAYAHIGYLGEYYCRVVIEESEKLLARNKLMEPQGSQTEGRERYASTYRRGTKAG